MENEHTYNKFSYLEDKPKKRATVNTDKFSLEQFDEDVCSLLDNNENGGYLGKGFISKNNRQFFDDLKILACFEYHMAGLKQLINYTRKKKDQDLPEYEIQVANDMETAEGRIMKKYE